MIRKHVLFILLLCLCLCAFVCGDDSNLDTLLTVAPDLIAPDTEGVVTDLTPEAWEKVRFVREYDLFQHLTGPEHHFWLLEGHADYDPEKDKARHEAAETRIAEIKEMEEAFFHKYIDADGISIIGNEMTHDKYFVMARDIFLMMTSKVPRLREPLRDHFYLCIVGGLEEDYRLVTRENDHWEVTKGDSFMTQAFPSWRWHIVNVLGGRFSERNFCAKGSIPYVAGTSSGLRKIRGWCVSGIFVEYPFKTYVHEIGHALETIQYEIDPTFKERQLLAHKNSNENDLWGTPTSVIEWWAAITSYWFFNVNPAFTTLENVPLYGPRFASYEEWAEYDPMTAELCRQWYPEISFTNLIANY